MREKLDWNYVNNNTAKGNAIEETVLYTFKFIRMVRVTNEEHLVIIFGRTDTTGLGFSISREYYLTNRNSQRQQIVVTYSDKYLYYLVEKTLNFLEYIEFKIFQGTANSPSSTFEMFTKTREVTE